MLTGCQLPRESLPAELSRDSKGRRLFKAGVDNFARRKQEEEDGRAFPSPARPKRRRRSENSSSVADEERGISRRSIIKRRTRRSPAERPHRASVFRAVVPEAAGRELLPDHHGEAVDEALPDPHDVSWKRRIPGIAPAIPGPCAHMDARRSGRGRPTPRRGG